jgi:hypothetical protein
MDNSYDYRILPPEALASRLLHPPQLATLATITCSRDRLTGIMAAATMFAAGK